MISQSTRTTIPTTEALLRPEVTDEVYDNIKRKRLQAKAAYGKHANQLPEHQVGEPVRLQQEQASPDISGTNPPSQTTRDAGSPAKSLLVAKADSLVK